MFIRSLVVAAAVSGSLGPSTTDDAQPFALAAREDETFGSRPGTLRLDEAGVVFETSDTKRGRRWAFDDVRQVRIESSHRLVIETYQSRGWRRAGSSRAYEYAMASPITPQVVAFLLARVTKPIVTAVLPPRERSASFTALVHHEGTDTDGTLALYDDGVAFETARDGYARFWRWSDLESVLRQDRYRLAIGSFEGAREHVRPFLFILKADLPSGMYDLLWRQVNRRSTTRQATLGATSARGWSNGHQLRCVRGET